MQQTTAEMADFTPPRPAQEPKSRRFRTFRVVMALMLREIGSRDSRSSLGFLWAIIDPIATVIVLTLVFSLLTKTPRLGTNFPLYYVSGVVPFQTFTMISVKVSGSIRYSRQLLGFPSVTVLDALFARAILNFLISVLVFVILTVAIIEYYDLRVNLDLGPVITGMTLAAMLGVGVGTFNAVLFLMVPAYDYLWGMLSRPLMIGSGAMLLITDMPDWIYNILWWNPASHVLAEVRHGFYPTYDVSWVSLPYVFLFCGVTFAVGLVTLQRFVYDALEN